MIFVTGAARRVVHHESRGRGCAGRGVEERVCSQVVVSHCTAGGKTYRPSHRPALHCTLLFRRISTLELASRLFGATRGTGPLPRLFPILKTVLSCEAVPFALCFDMAHLRRAQQLIAALDRRLIGRAGFCCQRLGRLYARRRVSHVSVAPKWLKPADSRTCFSLVATIGSTD
jgi:hypothetical protein